jgi:hypothetical protein
MKLTWNRSGPIIPTLEGIHFQHFLEGNNHKQSNDLTSFQWRLFPFFFLLFHASVSNQPYTTPSNKNEINSHIFIFEHPNAFHNLYKTSMDPYAH